MPDRRNPIIEGDVARPLPGPNAAPSWWSRTLDGAHRWGSVEAAVSRYGVRRYRLIVYPPGISTADRRLARLWRCWPISGAVLMLLVVGLLGNAAASPDTVLKVAVAAYVSIGALLLLRAGPLRIRVKSISIILLPNTTDLPEQRRFAECRTLVDTLTRADHMLTMGTISPVEHEATWWEAYDRIEAIAHV